MNIYYVAGVPYTSELYHHGILGQKWGRRRWQNKDGSWTSAGRIKYGQATTSQALSSMKKGSIVYRTSVNANEAEKGHAYVSANEVDRDHYRGGAGASWIKETSGGNKDTKIYESEYRLKRDPKVANREIVRDIYIELSKKNKKILNEAAKEKYKKEERNGDEAYNVKRDYEIAKNDAEEIIKNIGKEKYETMLQKSKDNYYNFAKKRTDEILKEIKSLSVDDMFDNYGATSFGGSDYTRNKVINELKKRGYDAMIDQASVGSSTRKEGIAPVIVFDRADLLEKVNTREVSNKEQEKYGKRYDKWQQKR